MTKDRQTNTAQTNRALPQGWREVSLGEVIEIISGGTPKTSEPKYWGGDIPWLSVVDFNNDLRWVKKTEKTITKEGLKNSATKILKRGTIIISARGTVGALAQVAADMAFNQSCYGIKSIEGVSDQDFLYYSLKFSINKFLKSSHGSVFSTITKSTFDNIKILLPPLPTQKAIAKVLSTFDDKIELLREQNETLEQIGQTLFKEWFGKYSPSRPDDLPEGWRVGKLGEVIETFLGGTPSRSKKEYWTNGTIPWINSGKVNDFRITEGSEMITQEAVEKSATKLLPKGTVVLAITGATLGQYSRLEIDACFNQSVVGLKENEKFKSSYIYFWVANNISHIIKHASGGAHQHINKENINQTDFIIPTEEYLNEYYKIEDVIMEKVSNNVFQIQTLTQTRNTLLPKLMKGEVLV